MVGILQEIDAVLTPIIGQGGAAALYRRCLFLTSSPHPWLADTHKGVQTTIDFAALQVVLAQQGSSAAIGAGDHLLQTFYELLATLVGPSLTERLLRSVWENSSSGPPAQDTSP